MAIKLRLMAGLPALAIIFANCSSGKTAYKHGDYYEAVMEAVQRLRQSPDNKKSKEVLSMSYQPAVDYLNTDAQNQITSNANFKWKAVVQDYNRINSLYESIRTSPGALKVIPDPVNKYKELTVAKDSAAAECYDRGLEAMLKNTREDAKQAFFLFTDANTFSPGYRESIEMLTQAKFNATLKVVVEPTFQNFTSWNFDPVIYGVTSNQFVHFYSQQEAQTQNLQKVDQYVRVSVNGYQENRPSITKNGLTYRDSVTVGEKVVSGRTVPNRQAINAQMTVYEKSVNASGIIQLQIRDGVSNSELMNTNLTSRPVWSTKWASCSGDQRAIPTGDRGLCGKAEQFPANGQLQVQAKRELDSQLTNALTSFYKNY